MGKTAPVLISLFASKWLGCPEFMREEESHKNLAAASEQGDLFRASRMESQGGNFLTSLIRARDLQPLG